MLVTVKTEKRQQTLGCHPSPLLSAVQLNRVQRLSVVQEKTCFNFSKGGRSVLGHFSKRSERVAHNWFVCTRRTSC